MNKQSASQKNLSSVINVLQILRLFTPKQQELSFTDIRKQLAIPKASANRYITSLLKEGMLSKNPRTNHYRLGLSILRLGGAIFNHHELYEEALPFVEKLSQDLDESVHICLMENEKVVYLFRVESNHSDRLVTQIGRSNPLHCTAEGLSILAFQHDDYIQQFLTKELYAYTPYTITNAKKLHGLLMRIREQAYCILQSSYYKNYTGIAVPIKDYTSDVVASLSVIGHSNRLTDAKSVDIVKQMKQTADKISAHMGYIPLD
ncbi:IclR family transcriptional regulator [Pseudogracilibacillus sp. SO30301A]|uniref:IclR family transcriptional regulator n=1 Tax=Pseudogracilibacillus sp. SO30301A TaxID=3098291 RepID=UPI00300E4918